MAAPPPPTPWKRQRLSDGRPRFCVPSRQAHWPGWPRAQAVCPQRYAGEPSHQARCRPRHCPVTPLALWLHTQVRTRCFAGDFQPPTPYQPGQDVSRWGIAMRRKQGVRCVCPLPVAHQEPAHQDWVASGCIPHTGLRVALHGPRLAALPRGACDCRPRCLWLMKTVWRRGAARSLHARSSIVPWLALRGRMPPCGLHPQAWNHPRVRDVTDGVPPRKDGTTAGTNTEQQALRHPACEQPSAGPRPLRPLLR